MTYPSYKSLIDDGSIEEIVDDLKSLLQDCMLCPRECRVNRVKGEKGFCRTGEYAVVSSYGPHFGEEHPLVGRHGSGTVFFTNCNLGCIFCQNYDISHLGRGEEVDPISLSSLFLKIQEMGCHNLNLVTPTHVVPQIMEALKIAAGKGFSLPLVYNCGGYESVDILKKISGIIDIYMPDMKFMDDDIARELTGAKNYSLHSKRSLLEMHRQVGDLIVNEGGIALSGLIVRHLILPEGMSGTGDLLEFISDDISLNTYINLMDQYHPCYHSHKYDALSRRISPYEYGEAVKLARGKGLYRIDSEI